MIHINIQLPTSLKIAASKPSPKPPARTWPFWRENPINAQAFSPNPFDQCTLCCFKDFCISCAKRGSNPRNMAAPGSAVKRRGDPLCLFICRFVDILLVPA